VLPAIDAIHWKKYSFSLPFADNDIDNMGDGLAHAVTLSLGFALHQARCFWIDGQVSLSVSASFLSVVVLRTDPIGLFFHRVSLDPPTRLCTPEQGTAQISPNLSTWNGTQITYAAIADGEEAVFRSDNAIWATALPELQQLRVRFPRLRTVQVHARCSEAGGEG